MADRPLLKLFRTRLLLLMLLLAVPALALIVYSNLDERRIETMAVRQEAIALSRLAAAREENLINNTRQLLATLSQISFLVLSTNHEVCEQHFSNLRRLLPDYRNFGLIETNGTLFATADPITEQINLGDRVYFKRVLQTKKFATGGYMVGRVTRLPVLAFGYPVLNDHGDLQRVLYASLELTRLSDALAQVPLPVDSSVVVLDRFGSVLARQPEPGRWVGESLSNSPVVKRMVGHRENVFEAESVEGVQQLYAVTRIADGSPDGLFVGVGIPAAVSYARANANLARNLGIFLAVAIVVWSAVRFFSQRFFLRPVEALAGAARQLAEGNLNSRVGPISGAAEELTQLGRTFDEMAARQQRRRQELEQAHQEIRTLNEGLEKRVAERTAELEAAFQQLESFSYSVSHDLRGPLRAIDGYSLAVIEDYRDKLDAEGADRLEHVRSSAKRMARLIDDLLGLSRVSRRPLRRADVDLSALAEGVIADLRKAEPGREVKVTITPGLRVNADDGLLRIALENLLGNAWKFTRRSEKAKIELGVIPGAISSEYYVRDNGAGFDMAYADKLFDAFQRLHRASEFEGTGIGLATVHRVVRRHGGHVRAEAEVGKGATFYFTLG
jgi:signal transduction histidine kinase